jgi:hypothetical protein
MRFNLVWLLAMGAIACASDDDPTTLTEVVRVTDVTTRSVLVPVPESEVWLFVVDDADTPEAIALREAVAKALRLPSGPYPVFQDACPGTNGDPTRQDPIDVRVIVAHPALSQRERLVTPSDLPELTLLGERDDLDNYERWRAAVAAELLRAPAQTSERHAPLETMVDTLSLLAGQRLPRSGREAEQLQSLASLTPPFVQVFYFTTRDDASPYDVASYDVASSCDQSNYVGMCPFIRTLLLDLAGRSITEFSAPRGQAQPRNAAFLEPLEWTSSSSTPDDLFDPILNAKVGYSCWDSKPRWRADGSVDCRIHLLTQDLAACDPARGRLNPLADNGVARLPRIEFDEALGEVRVCEIRQLEGAALDRCLNHPEQPQYTGGFCHPEPSELCRSLCGDDGQRYPFAFRFVAGSTRVTSPARLRYECRLEAVP